nr:MAG TPA: hypothetical protein [Caudoviricetes sp.]DAO99857.1 MAG TPA: hypothetical protein [Caudoviricetes sp.]
MVKTTKCFNEYRIMSKNALQKRFLCYIMMKRK